MTLVTSREAPKSKYEQFNKKNPFFRFLRKKSNSHHNFSLAWQSHIGLEPQKSSL